MTTGTLKLEQEVSSIRDRYARRGDDLSDKSVFHAHRLETSLEKQAAMVRMLVRNLKVPISAARILEIGCGHGDNLLQFLLWGADAANLVGNELLEERLTYSRKRLPEATALVVGDARTLDLEPGSFDIVMASTVFSSILDLEFRAELARHLWTLVKPGGGIFWYDFAFNNPSNPDVLKVTRAEVKALFPEARADIERLTLAPPIARQLAPIGAPLYRMASAVPLLRTHLLGWLEKRAA